MPDKMEQHRSGGALHVLVVEDEFLIALDLQFILENEGYIVIGPAGSVDAALGILESGCTPDIAVLDVNLRGQPVVPVAERLRILNVPFVLASAYSTPEIHGDILKDAENIAKPISTRRLLDALNRTVERGRS